MTHDQRTRLVALLMVLIGETDDPEMKAYAAAIINFVRGDV